MELPCPACQKKLVIKDQYAGKKMKCPLCQGTFTAPALPSHPASAEGLPTAPSPKMPANGLPLIRVTVEVETVGGVIVISREIAPSVRVIELIQQILNERLAGENLDGWELLFRGQPLPPDALIKDVFRDGIAQETLRLRCKPVASGVAISPAPVSESTAPTVAGAFEEGIDESDSVVFVEEDAQGVDLEEDVDYCLEEDTGLESSSEFELTIDDDLQIVPEEEGDEEANQSARPRVAEGAPVANTLPRKSRTGPRRATVRHYQRMNPERVYPLLVFLTEQVVERISKTGTAQRSSGPFQVDLEAVVEVEPVLPGCLCYPPRATARLDSKNLSFNFHIVPQVLGMITGAKVLIRQDHRTLAEVELKAKVVQRTAVLFCGVLTFVLPFLSSLAKHFGLDFQSQQEAGFSLYLAIAQTLFQTMSPLVLTLILASVTGWFYWRTRPQARETFWDLNFVSPGTLLRKIGSELRDNPKKAARDIVDLVQSYPNYQPALLVYATLQGKQKNFEAALDGYEKAFRLGGARPEDYLRASLAASRLRLNEKALGILRLAVKALPPQKITGVMWFNMGCYYARLGQLDQVIPCLRKAVQTGFRKIETYRTDPDLKPVRARQDFQLLVKRLARIGT